MLSQTILPIDSMSIVTLSLALPTVFTVGFSDKAAM